MTSQAKLRELLTRTNGKQKQIAKCLSDLVQFRSENPPVDNYDVQLYIRDELKASGLNVSLHHPRDKAVALTSSFGSGRKGLILYGHVDVVPAGDKSKWRSPPYSGKIVGRRIYGRGAADMKAGVTALLYAYKLLYESEIELPGKLEFVTVLDEENWHPTPIGLGTSDWLLATGRLTGRACIMGEPSGISNICIGERGDLWVKLTSKGKAAHGSTATHDENAFVRLFKCIDEINQATKKRIAPPKDIRQIVNGSYKVIGESPRTELLEHYSMNVGVVSGGVMINIVPQMCEAEVAFCIPLGATWQELDRKIQGILRKQYYKNITIDPTFPSGAQSNPTYTSPNSHLVKTLSHATRQILGKSAAVCVTQGTSDANVFRRHGVDTCFYGPGALEDAHSYNESVNIGEILTSLKVYLRFVGDFFRIL